jgi:hypothetical protein
VSAVAVGREAMLKAVVSMPATISCLLARLRSRVTSRLAVPAVPVVAAVGAVRVSEATGASSPPATGAMGDRPEMVAMAAREARGAMPREAAFMPARII